MSSSRPPETTDSPSLPDPTPADLPDPADGALPPDLAVGSVGFTDVDAAADDDGAGESEPAKAASLSAARPSARERLAGIRDGVRPWSAWTLRAKLVASMLVLFTAISLFTGAFTVVALGRQLTSQVDDQLQSSMVRLLSDRRGID